MTANDVTKTRLSVRHRQRNKNMQQTLILDFLNLKWGPEDVGGVPIKWLYHRCSTMCIIPYVSCLVL